MGWFHLSIFKLDAFNNWFFNSSPTSGGIWSKQDILPICATISTSGCCSHSCHQWSNLEGLEPYNNWETFWVWCTVFSSADKCYSFQVPGRATIQVSKHISYNNLFVCMHSILTSVLLRFFRIDYLLGRNLIENLTVLRFCILIFELLWSQTYIHNIPVILSFFSPLNAMTFTCATNDGHYLFEFSYRSFCQKRWVCSLEGAKYK